VGAACCPVCAVPTSPSSRTTPPCRVFGRQRGALRSLRLTHWNHNGRSKKQKAGSVRPQWSSQGVLPRGVVQGLSYALPSSLALLTRLHNPAPYFVYFVLPFRGAQQSAQARSKILHTCLVQAGQPKSPGVGRVRWSGLACQHGHPESAGHRLSCFLSSSRLRPFEERSANRIRSASLSKLRNQWLDKRGVADPVQSVTGSQTLSRNRRSMQSTE